MAMKKQAEVPVPTDTDFFFFKEANINQIRERELPARKW